MKPLYIDGKTGCRVVWDAPALKVLISGQADQLFPVSRVSRVVSGSSVEWSMEAMMACADSGIAIVFVDREGNSKARLLGKNGERQVFLQRLTDLMARVDGLEHYHDWLHSMERLAVRSSARKFGFQDWRSVTSVELREHFSAKLPPSWWMSVKAIRGFLFADLADKLGRCGLGADSEALQEYRLDLVADFTRLLVWDFYWPLLCWNRRHNAVPETCEMVLFYENRSERIDHLFRGTVNKMHQWLLGKW